ALVAVDLDRIEIAHYDNRRSTVGFTKLDDPAQNLRQTYAFGERSLTRMLDHRAVGHRIGKRRTELDHVGAGAHERVHQSDDVAGRRISRSDERDQALAVGGLEGGKARVEAIHSVIPSLAAIVCTSLSPRPDKFTSIILSFCIPRASFSACATA